MKNQRLPQNENNDKIFLESVGMNIRLLRTAKKISQEELGYLSDYDRTYIGGIERGERNITIIALKRLADSLQCEITELLK